MKLEEIDIKTLLPQQEPVIMVDRLLAADQKSAVSALDIREDNIFVEEGTLRPYALIENMAQTCAAQLGYVDRYVLGRDSVRMGYIGAVKQMRAEHAPRVGETLTTRVEILEDVMDIKLVAAESFVGERRVASAEMKIALSGEMEER